VKSTRPAGESRLRPRTKNVTLSTLAALKAVTSKARSFSKDGQEVSRMGPRTKNVNYHIVKMEELLTATFPARKSKLIETVMDSLHGRKQENVESVSTDVDINTTVNIKCNNDDVASTALLEDEK
jgi:hypothetical protein